MLKSAALFSAKLHQKPLWCNYFFSVINAFSLFSVTSSRSAISDFSFIPVIIYYPLFFPAFIYFSVSHKGTFLCFYCAEKRKSSHAFVTAFFRKYQMKNILSRWSCPALHFFFFSAVSLTNFCKKHPVKPLNGQLGGFTQYPNCPFEKTAIRGGQSLRLVRKTASPPPIRASVGVLPNTRLARLKNRASLIG